MGRTPPLFALLAVSAMAGLFASCCEPAHRNSSVAIVDSLFQEQHGYDIDLFTTRYLNNGVTDSGYYPIYTFGVTNTGTEDDLFTMHIRYYSSTVNGAAIDITKAVKAGQTVLFRTPTIPKDPLATYAFPVFSNPSDSTMPLSSEYYGFFVNAPDSTEIHTMRPQITIEYGAINNGPEACNTPSSLYVVNIDRLLFR